MTNLSRLGRLEKQANEHRRQRKLKPLKDYSELSDEDLKALYEGELEKMMAEPNPYAGMSNQQLSDLYMEQIQTGNAKNVKRLK